MAFTPYVGQKVECIMDSLPEEAFPHVKKGRIYTIIQIITEEGWTPDGPWGKMDNLLFEELAVNSDDPDWTTGYHIDCFRPIVEKGTETGMAILRKILDRPDIKIKEDA